MPDAALIASGEVKLRGYLMMSDLLLRSFLLAAIACVASSQVHAQDAVCSTDDVVAPFLEGSSIKAGLSVKCSERATVGGNLTIESMDPYSGDIYQSWNRPYNLSDTLGFPTLYVTLDCHENPPRPGFTMHRLHAFWGAYISNTNVGDDEIVTDWIDLGDCQ